MERPLAIFFDSNSPEEYPFSVERYRQSYQLLSTTAAAQAVDLRFVLSRSAIQNNPATFSHYWIWEGAQMKRIDQPFTAGVIMNKSSYRFPENAPTINLCIFEDIAQNKLLTNTYFSRFVKPSYPAIPALKHEIARSIQTEQVVVKPVMGVSGKDIVILPKDRFLADITSYADRFFLVQEYIDASKGIPGLVEGNHDLRIILFDAKPRLSYIRTPAPGKQLANIALGGSVFAINLSDVPQSVHAIVSHCISVLKPLGGSIFTIDFMIEDGHPYLLEINDQPGFPSPQLGEFTRQFHQYFLETMLRKRDSSLVDRTPEVS